jgi:hypothetical protein
MFNFITLKKCGLLHCCGLLNCLLNDRFLFCITILLWLNFINTDLHLFFTETTPKAQKNSNIQFFKNVFS